MLELIPSCSATSHGAGADVGTSAALKFASVLDTMAVAAEVKMNIEQTMVKFGLSCFFSPRHGALVLCGYSSSLAASAFNVQHQNQAGTYICVAIR